MTDNYSIINRQFIKNSEATVLITDLAVQRGYGIFDFFVTYNGKPVFLEDHLDRFYNSVATMRLAPIPDRAELTKLIYKLIELNNMPNSGIRITVTGGYSPDGYGLAAANVLITQNFFVYDNASFAKGISLVTHQYQRQLSQVKTIDYLQAVYLQPFIKENDADEVLYHNNGELRECPRANFFLVTKDNEIVTPESDVLWGVNRRKILSFEEFDAKATSVKLSDIETAKEAFITSTTKIVLPVFAINGKQIGNGKPGELTTKLFEKLYALRVG